MSHADMPEHNCCSDEEVRSVIDECVRTEVTESGQTKDGLDQEIGN